MTHPPLNTVLQHLRQLIRVPDSDARTDRHLLQQFVQRHDEGAFAELVRRHGPMVLGVCRRLLGDAHAAEDAFQATFLVLVRKAGAIPWRETIGSWLYQVACRTARKAQVTAARRASHEKEAGTMRPRQSESPIEGRELRALLDEEVQRLPAKYRLPVVLCCLEGLSKAGAARQLGWKEGTVSSRLAQGRELLRERLARRGVLAAAGGLALTAEATAAAVPAALAQTTVKAALVLAAGQAAAGGASASVAALVKGVIHDTFLVRLKLTLAVALAVGVALGAGAGTLAYRAGANKPSEANPSDPAPAAAPGAPKPPGDAKPGIARFGDPLPQGALARLGTTRVLNGGKTSFVVLSPDEKTLATVDEPIGVRLWDVATGKQTKRLDGLLGKVVYGLVFSPDSKTLFVRTEQSSLWDVTTGQMIHESEEKEEEPLAFSPDGKTVARVGAEGIRLLDVATEKELLRLPKQGFSTAALSPDGKTLAAAGGFFGEEHTICFWDVATGKELRKLKGGRAKVGSLAFSPGGRFLAWGGQTTVRLWEVATGKEIAQLQDDDKEVLYLRSVAFTPDGKVLVWGGFGAVHLYEVATGTELRQVEGASRCNASPFALSRDGKNLITGGQYEAIRIWDMETGREREPKPGHRAQVTTVVFSPDGKTLATAGQDQTIRLWEVATGKEIRRLLVGTPPADHPWPQLLVAFSADGKSLATAAPGQPVRLWEVATGKEIRQLPQPAAESLAFSPDGQTLASGDRDGLIHLWDVAAGKVSRTFPRVRGRAEAVTSIAFSPDGKVLASGYEGAILLWEVATAREIYRLRAEESKGGFGQFAFSPDGKTLAAQRSGTRESGVQLWEVATGKEIRTLDKAGGPLAFSPDGKMLAAGLGLWQVSTGKLIGQLPEAQGGILSVAFSPDGKALASGGCDTTVLLWDVPRWQLSESPAQPRTNTLQTYWVDLAGDDAPKAFRAIQALADWPEQTVPYLKERLRPVPAPDPRDIGRLIADLDSDQFAVREAASKELTKLGELARPALTKARDGQPSVEARRRIQELLDPLEKGVLAPEQLQALRAVQVLERIGTPEAKQVLQALSQGAPPARLTRDAQAALDRLARHPVTP
jgi:RNA polymerase sigma factor (sigma-70 family)